MTPPSDPAPATTPVPHPAPRTAAHALPHEPTTIPVPLETPQSPNATTALSDALGVHLQEVTELTSTITELVAALPERMRQWVIGEAGTSRAIPVERWEGDWAAEYAWRDLFFRRKNAGTVPREVCGIFPDVNRFADPTPEGTASFAGAISHYERARAIFQDPMPDFASEFMRPYLITGAELKTHHSLPTWLWADSDSTVAFPDVWGQSNPTSVTLFHSPVLASVAIELFEHVWTTGKSLPAYALHAEWASILQLMYEGATIESASRILGINPRTGRRRVKAAMQYYGVDSPFELGLAWGQDIAQQPRRASSTSEDPRPAATRGTDEDRDPSIHDTPSGGEHP